MWREEQLKYCLLDEGVADKPMLVVDDVPVQSREWQGRRVLFSAIYHPVAFGEREQIVLRVLAQAAAVQRVFPEAFLAWDEAEQGVIVWQALPGNAEQTGDFGRQLEAFLNARAGWLALVAHVTAPGAELELPRFG